MDTLILMITGFHPSYFEYWAKMLTIRALGWYTGTVLKCPRFGPATASER
jgi:hypothetical protein